MPARSFSKVWMSLRAVFAKQSPALKKLLQKTRDRFERRFDCGSLLAFDPPLSANAARNDIFYFLRFRKPSDNIPKSRMISVWRCAIYCRIAARDRSLKCSLIPTR